MLGKHSCTLSQIYMLMEGDLFPFRSLRHSSILKFALLVVIAIFVGVGGAKADNDAAIARQKAANQKLEAARCPAAICLNLDITMPSAGVR